MDSTMKIRPDKDHYYLNIAREVARRSTCLRRWFGAVIVKNDQIISTGYAGAARGALNCSDLGYCPRQEAGIPRGERYELCRSVHAEQNAIINAARAGVSLLGGDMYLYGSKPEEDGPIDALPCFICKKMIINAGLDRVICSTKEGGIINFKVSEWAEEWQKNDIIDDKHQYG